MILATAVGRADGVARTRWRPVFDIVPGMAGRRDTGGGGRRKSLTPVEREQAERDFRLAVYRFQDSAYANLRSAVANVAIFCGTVAVFMISDGAADGALLAPTVVFVLAGLIGAGYYPARSRPRRALRLLLVASLLVVVGVVGVVLAQVTGGER
jgi:hypothetical protein